MASKTCMICGARAAADATTCASCGEASWAYSVTKAPLAEKPSVAPKAIETVDPALDEETDAAPVTLDVEPAADVTPARKRSRR